MCKNCSGLVIVTYAKAHNAKLSRQRVTVNDCLYVLLIPTQLFLHSLQKKKDLLLVAFNKQLVAAKV